MSPCITICTKYLMCVAHVPILQSFPPCQPCLVTVAFSQEQPPTLLALARDLDHSLIVWLLPSALSFPMQDDFNVFFTLQCPPSTFELTLYVWSKQAADQSRDAAGQCQSLGLIIAARNSWPFSCCLQTTEDQIDWLFFT